MLLFRLMSGGGGRVVALADWGWEGEDDSLLRKAGVFSVFQRWECMMIEDGDGGLWANTCMHRLPPVFGLVCLLSCAGECALLLAARG